MAGSSKLTKAQIIAALSQESGLDKKAVNGLLDELAPAESAYDHLRARLPNLPEAKVRARAYPTKIAAGAEVIKGPYVAETVPVTVEEHYVVVEF